MNQLYCTMAAEAFMAIFHRDSGTEGSGASETIIGSSVKVDGNFIGKGNLVVEGKVTGSMKTNHDIRITQGAMVKANIEAQNIFVAGEIHGSVKAHERLELSESAKIYGDVETRTVSIVAGAVLNGKCTMLSESVGQPTTEVDEKQSRERFTRFGKQRKQEQVP